jgi:hypothetical protein
MGMVVISLLKKSDGHRAVHHPSYDPLGTRLKKNAGFRRTTSSKNIIFRRTRGHDATDESLRFRPSHALHASIELAQQSNNSNRQTPTANLASPSIELFDGYLFFGKAYQYLASNSLLSLSTKVWGLVLLFFVGLNEGRGSAFDGMHRSDFGGQSTLGT